MVKQWLGSFVVLSLLSMPQVADRVGITLDTSEADQVLTILHKRQTGVAVTAADWQALFATEPYRRLKQRESSMRRPFSDEEFMAFVLSDELATRQNALERTLADWKGADLAAAATRVLSYLPDTAMVRAKVFTMIKPRDNSFVFDMDTDPTIFLAVSTKMTKERFANTVAHEMHHVGLASTDKQYEARLAALPPRAKKAAMWMGAFGEGLAMLAAAGGPGVSPTWAEGPEEQTNWTAGMANFEPEFAKVNAFFEQVLDGTLEGDAVGTKASTFFGDIRGPWYFVGYRMAVLVETHLGRGVLIACMLDYRQLLEKYNQVAGELNRSGAASMPLWSDRVIRLRDSAIGFDASPF